MPTDAIPQEYPLELRSAIDDVNRAYQKRTLTYVRHCGPHAEKVRAAARAAQIPLHCLEGTAVGMGTIRQLEIANQRSDDELAQCSSLGQACAQEYELDIKQDDLPSMPPEPKSWVYANRLNFGKWFGVGETDRHPVKRASEESSRQNTPNGEETAWWKHPLPDELKQAERKALEKYLHRHLPGKGYASVGTSTTRQDVFQFSGLSPKQAEQDLAQLVNNWFREQESGGPLLTDWDSAPQEEAGGGQDYR